MPVDPTNDIAGFIQNFAGGGVRTNLFMVQGNIPGYSNANSRAISFLCKAAQIPASSLGTIEVPYRGRRIKFPGDRTFQDWTITVISDANMSLRSAFENWSTNFNTHVSNTGATNLGPLMPQWSVTQLRRDGEPLRTYTFIGCFPSEVGAIDLSYENNDTIAEFPVTINYSYWVAAPGGPANNATGNGNLLGSLLQGAGINIGTGF